MGSNQLRCSHYSCSFLSQNLFLACFSAHTKTKIYIKSNKYGKNKLQIDQKKKIASTTQQDFEIYCFTNHISIKRVCVHRDETIHYSFFDWSSEVSVFSLCLVVCQRLFARIFVLMCVACFFFARCCHLLISI